VKITLTPSLSRSRERERKVELDLDYEKRREYGSSQRAKRVLSQVEGAAKGNWKESFLSVLGALAG
jgi:hypothetical protein